MKKSQTIVLGMAVVFVLWGLMWFVTIQKRLEVICPKPAIVQALGENTTSTSPAQPLIPEPKKVRSPHAKDYHFFLFETLTYAEYFLPILYVLAGIFILRQFVLSFSLAVVVLVADICFKILAVSYMAFCATPLSVLIRNPNVMYLYFTPDQTIYSEFSTIVTGLKLFSPGNIYFLIVYVFYFMFCFWLLAQPEVRQFLAKKKK